MSTINTLFSGNSYQLNAEKNATANSSDSSQALQALVSQTQNPSLATNEKRASDLLDLTKEAQDYLARISTSAAQAEKTQEVTPFILSRKDQAKLDSIITSYKDKPFTQESFDQMQQELKSAGLSADHLAAKEKMRTLSPARMFIDIMAGNDPAPVVHISKDTNLQAKAERYMTDVITRWSEISTTIEDETGDLIA